MRLKPLTSVDTLYVAASMTRPSQAETGADLERIHRNMGYSKIACHFVIERSGRVHEGRPLNEPGALAAKLNSRSYQVCLLGGVDDAMKPAPNFTKSQLNALDHLRRRFGLPVAFASDFPR